MHSHSLPQNTGDTQTLSQLSSSWRKFNTNSRGGEERFYFISFLSATSSSSYFVPSAAIITNTTWSWNCCLLRLRSLSQRLEETRHEPIVIGPSSSRSGLLLIRFLIDLFARTKEGQLLLVLLQGPARKKKNGSGAVKSIDLLGYGPKTSQSLDSLFTVSAFCLFSLLSPLFWGLIPSLLFRTGRRCCCYLQGPPPPEQSIGGG